MNTVTKTTLQSLALASTLIFFTACGGGSSTKTASVDATVTTTTDDGSTTTSTSASGETTTTTTDDGVADSTAIGTTVTGDTAPIIITHNGTSYGLVKSPYTNRIWLDRNLGAARVCTSFNDTACYGDYYQWGRNADGHQDSTSGVTAELAANVTTVGDIFFIKNSTSPYDWASIDSGGGTRVIQWSKTDGSSVCPVGYRVPTIAELKRETILATTAISNKEDAFNSFLKLPSQGFRSGSNGSMSSVGTYGSLWSVTININTAGYIYYANDSGAKFGRFSSGAGVRCIKN